MTSPYLRADRRSLAELADPAAYGRGRILLVEDDDALRDMLGEMLRRAGFSVRSVSDGLAAVELLRADAFDAVVSDIVMPRSDGLELLRWLRSTGLRTPLLAISGNGPDRGELYGKAADIMGADLYLPKPVSREALVAGLDRLIAEDADHPDAARDPGPAL